MNKARITIELDDEFVNLLRANLTVAESIRMSDSEPIVAKSADALHILGLAVLGEATSTHPEHTHRKIPPCWRSHIDIIPEARKVIGLETH
jgi:hypothetical protein